MMEQFDDTARADVATPEECMSSQKFHTDAFEFRANHLIRVATRRLASSRRCVCVRVRACGCVAVAVWREPDPNVLVGTGEG